MTRKIKVFNYLTRQILECYASAVVKILLDFRNRVIFLLMECMDLLRIYVIDEVATVAIVVVNIRE